MKYHTRRHAADAGADVLRPEAGRDPSGEGQRQDNRPPGEHSLRGPWRKGRDFPA